MKDKLKIGIVGLGRTRGYPIFEVFCGEENAEVVGLCDLYDERINAAEKRLEELGKKRVFSTKNYSELLAKAGPDAVFIATSWNHHVDIAVEAMERGIAVAMEVGGAYSEEDCWRLVRTYERTKTPFMYMENCCFNRSEMMLASMARDGLFGKIVHCSGSYAHDLRDEVFTGEEKKHYRIHDYMLRNCENYPTHELGPLAKMLDINCGNRMLSLVCMASDAIGMEEYAAAHGADILHKKFRQSDVVNTIIKCAGGQTITLKLDTVLPRYYDRNLVVEGTKGLFSQSLYAVFLDGIHKEKNETFETVKSILGNAAEYEEKYLPDIWKGITAEEQETGHGGMDILMIRYFIGSLLGGRPLSPDVYDAASWMSVSYLTEQSLLCGGAPQPIPDFTRGKWLDRKANPSL